MQNVFKILCHQKTTRRRITKSSLRNAHTQSINEVVIVSATRTPICSFQSRLACLSAPRLGSIAIEAAVKRAAMPHDCIHDLYMGNALTAGVGQAPARQSALLANLPKGVCCTTVNKVCASGMKAIALAAQSLQLGHSDVALAGGMESMSNVPFYLERGAIPYGGTELRDGIIYDALSDYCSKIALSYSAQQEAQRLAISQAELDTYGKVSYVRAMQAVEQGAFWEEITPIILNEPSKPTEIIQEDEELKQPLPAKGGNKECAVSALNDGAAALVLCTEKRAKELNLSPLAKILGYLDVETEPSQFALAPALAVMRLLHRLNITKDRIKRWEINDDVALLPLAFMKQLEIPYERVNMDGGALALGHPIGMSGARVVGHLAHALEKPGDLGCASICDGDGGASVIIIEKLSNSYYADYARPMLTLYTNNHCPLCDLLMEQLQSEFGGEYLLEKINIADKQNVRFLRLYRHDIPVVFFNGQFLCMHRLDSKLLRRKINLFKSSMFG